MKFSIIIVGFKALDQLNKCLESLIENPPDKEFPEDPKVSAEIIFIDNSPERLKPLEDARLFKKMLRTYVEYTEEWHPENMGFAAACNRGVELSSGENIVLVNPDTQVFPEWSRRMSAHMVGDVGAVGPISNFVAGWQRADLHMQELLDHEKNAKYAMKGNNKRGLETRLLIGFFMMIKREAWEKVGGMDPQFFLGCDDLDLSMRLREAGYALIIASDVFVYHEGHACFNTTPTKAMELNKQSEKLLLAKLKEKYGDEIPTSTELWGCEILPTYVPKRMTLSVCMIVRDEDVNLTQLIPQLGFADEVVIVDTNPDNQVYPFEGVSPEPGRRWYGFPWVDDFAAARNFALSKCTGDYILWLDADDRVPEESAKLIRAAFNHPGPLTQAKKACFGFIVKSPTSLGGNSYASQSRMFPNIEGMKWERRVHETYIPSALALGLHLISTNIEIEHTGYADAEVMLQKHARNLRLMEMEEDSPHKFYHMAKNLQALGRYDESERCYKEVLSGRWAAPLEKPFRDQVRYCMASLIMAVQGKSVDSSIDPYLEDNDTPDATVLRAEVAFFRGDIDTAEALYAHYAGLESIINDHGSEKDYLQGWCRDRIKLIESIREQVGEEIIG